MKFSSHKKLILFSFFLALILITAGCARPSGGAAGQEEFDAFTSELFKSEVQSDSITLNYTLSHPENYGITGFTPTLGHCTLDAARENLAKAENIEARLKTFDPNRLSEKSRLLYDILKDYYHVEKNMEDFLLYSESLDPTSGIQAQLPVLLAEYNFNTKADFEHYLKLLTCVPDYYKEIGDFERRKADAGLFMSDTTADAIIAQCKSFIEEPEDNYLIDIFNERVTAFPGLTEKEKNAFQDQNRRAILNSVIPAYQDLIQTLSSLKGSGKNEGGLCNFPNGKEYYEMQAQAITGSDKTVRGMKKMLDTASSNAISDMKSVLLVDPKALDKAENVTYPLTDPVEIIDYLKTAITNEFPPLNSADCTVKYVHKSLEDYLSPAFYLTPPLDNFESNSIYINGSDQYDASNLFTTVAHEGYPGHLYQTVYYMKQQPEPVRQILNFGGYSEGWATYVELYSYSIAGIDENAARLLKDNKLLTLCMYGKIDLGIHYYGWTMEDTADFLASYGVDDEGSVKAVYDTIVAEPCNYLKYIIGCLEFMELRETAEKKQGDAFDPAAFHQFILETGPCPFYILQERMEKTFLR